jgi:phenylalanyl-tRNA synthetase beta chain
VVNGNAVGAAGIVSEKVKDKFDFKDLSPCAAELDFEQLSALQAGPVKVKPIPKFPAIERDLSIIVAESITWADITRAVNKKACNELEDIQFVGIYHGKGIPSGQKSVTLKLTFRDEDGTLTHETVDRFEADIVKGLTKSIGAKLRTV